MPLSFLELSVSYFYKHVGSASSQSLAVRELCFVAREISRGFFVKCLAPDFPGNFKNLLMPLFLMGCFPVDFQDAKRPLRTKSVKRPIKVGKRPINKGKRPIKNKVLVGVSVGSLMGCFRAPPPWRKTAPLKRPTKRSMKIRGRESAIYLAKISPHFKSA